MVGCAIVEQPFALEQRHTVRYAGIADEAVLFPVEFGLDKGLLQTLQDRGAILTADQGLAEGPSAIAPVVKQKNAIRPLQRDGPGFMRTTVETSRRAILPDSLTQGFPVDEVIRLRQLTGMAYHHKVFTIDFLCDESVAFTTCNDDTATGAEHTFRRQLGKGGAMLGPVDEVLRSGHQHSVALPIPGGIVHVIRA